MEKRNITYGLPILNNNLKLLEPLEKLKDYNPLSTRFGAQLGSEYYLDDEVCVRDWLNEKYTRNPYKPEHLIYETKSGELVRSKSEMMIADILTEYSIPYKLEKPLNVKGKLIYPDFELLHIPTRKLFWWEHFGKLDDPKYVLKNLNRIDDLADCGIIIEKNLIITWESDGCPLTRGVIIKKLKRHSFI
jgi:hypothetical protein